MTSRLRSSFLVVAAAAVGAAAPADAQTLVRDIDPTRPPTNGGSFASDFAPLGSRYLFQGNHPSGKQILITDGTPAGTQLVTQEHQATSFLQPQLTAGAELNGVRYFRCSALGTGSEIWRSDGTRAGTHLFVDLNPGTASASASEFVEAGGLIFFKATAPPYGEELWVTDGTVAGTRCLDVVPGPGASRPFWVRRFGNRVLFRAGNGFADGEPWISDGTPAGTFRLRDIQPGPTNSYPSEFVEMNGRAYFWADDPTVGYELWETDGTPAGTVVVTDIHPGGNGSYPRDLVVVPGVGTGNDVLFFTADDGFSGREIWKSDGTAAGTVQVADIAAGGLTSEPDELAVFGSRVVFSASTPTSGREPWITDGSAGGTFQLAELTFGAGDSNPNKFTAVPAGGFVVFRAHTPSSGWEMFRTDGTAAGTRLAMDFNPGPPDGLDDRNNFEFGVLGAQVVLGADDGVHGDEPWISDGTFFGSQLLLDVSYWANGSEPTDPIQLEDKTLFFADDGVHGRELWITDGTGAGTQLVVDLSPFGNGARGPWIRFRDELFFFGHDGTNGGLFCTDGTAAGTSLAAAVAGSSLFFLTEYAIVDDRLFLVVGSELLVWDGVASAPTSLRRFPVSFPFGVAPNGLTAFAGRVFFTAEENHDAELWVSDGTVAGTQQFVDLNPARSSSPQFLTVSGDRLFFRASDDPVGAELWATDGTVAGTQLVRDIRSGTGSSYPDSLIDVDGQLFFTASPNFDRELWTSDGTAAGTRLVRNINPSGSSDIQGMTALGDRLLFHVAEPISGREPWISDGTAVGTRLLRDVFPGDWDSMLGGSNRAAAPFWVVGSGRVALFGADDGEHGRELWRTDGTTVGTYRLTDLALDLLSSDPTAIGRSGATVFFAASDFDHGEELWSMPLLDTGDSLAAGYGRGCDGSNGRPVLRGDGAPFVGNAAFALTVENAFASTTAIMLVQGGASPSPIASSNGCLLYPDLPAIGAPFAIGAAGTGSIPLPVPATATLRGLELFGQAVVFDPGGAWAGVSALTNPVHVLVGD